MTGLVPLHLGHIRACLEGAVPGVIATCSEDGTPNVAYLSQVFYMDDQHLALSFQFFNKTRRNILANPVATLLVLHPVTAAFYRLHIRFLRTEVAGPLFEGMKAQLAGIASHSGMADVFVLRGADIYEVTAVETVAGQPLPDPPVRCGLLGMARRTSEAMSRATTLDDLLALTLDALQHGLGVRHAMMLMADGPARKLYTVASRGYATSGVGSEIEFGKGVIGMAAQERTPVRIMHLTSAHLYNHAVRSSLQARAPELALSTDIPYPGLPEPHSQLAVPVVSADRLLGVLFVESPEELRFSFEDEDLLVTLAGHLGAAIDVLQGSAAEQADAPTAPDPAAARPAGLALAVRRLGSNDSIFLDGRYLVKGVAGAIFWKIASDFTRCGRTEFTNRELRLDPSLRLPDVTDNLEARLLLLQRRLAEHGPEVRMEKSGRGRFRLCATRPLLLSDAA